MTSHELKPGFSNVQLELLKLYANGIPDEQLEEVKWLLGKYFAEKATLEVNKAAQEKGLSAQDFVTKSKEHHRSENRG